jgi:hypothetical protein
MSASLNCCPEWNNYQNCNFYGTNNSINCDPNEQYNQKQFYNQQHLRETNYRFHQIRNNLSQFYGAENHHDKRNVLNKYTHHPNWVRYIRSY